MFAFITSRCSVSPENVLDDAEKAIKANNYAALAEAAKEIIRLLPQKSFLVEPLIIVVARLGAAAGYTPAAVAAARVAYERATSGSELARQAEAVWAKHLNAFAAMDAPSMVAAPAAVVAARDAYDRVLFGSERALQASQKTQQPESRLAPLLPTEQDARKFIQQFRLG